MDRVLRRHDELATVLVGLPPSVGESGEQRALVAALRVGRDDLLAPRAKRFPWKADLDAVVRTLRVAAEHRAPAPAQFLPGNVLSRRAPFAEAVSGRLLEVEAQVA